MSVNGWNVLWGVCVFVNIMPRLPPLPEGTRLCEKAVVMNKPKFLFLLAIDVDR